MTLHGDPISSLLCSWGTQIKIFHLYLKCAWLDQTNNKFERRRQRYSLLRITRMSNHLKKKWTDRVLLESHRIQVLNLPLDLPYQVDSSPTVSLVSQSDVYDIPTHLCVITLLLCVQTVLPMSTYAKSKVNVKIFESILTPPSTQLQQRKCRGKQANIHKRSCSNSFELLKRASSRPNLKRKRHFALHLVVVVVGSFRKSIGVEKKALAPIKDTHVLSLINNTLYSQRNF